MAKKSLKRNGQEYQPPYQFWHEADFWADECVSRGMNFMQRHLYRALLQAAFYCSTRPYLPIIDDELWILADAGTLDNWAQNKTAIMVKFQEIEVKGVKVLSHKRLLRDWIKLIEGSEMQSKRRKGKQPKKAKTEGGKETPSNDGDGDIEANESEL
ncbi:MAG: hypothetical protein WAM79_05535 [Candidatus Sulfotelmatobacter sp.]